MPTVIKCNKQIEIDESGFMRNPELWDEEIARILAAEDGLPSLSDDHWKLIRFVRAYYLKHNSAPLVRKLCSETGIRLASLYELFPNGPANGLCKIAGLDRPNGCV